MAHQSAARFTRRYTDEQKTALLEAHLLHGLSIAECMRRARAGTLKDGLAPFGSTRRFAYDLVKKGREAFEAQNDEALANSTRAALKAAHVANLKALRSLGEDADPAERARVAKALADTSRSLATTTDKTTKPKAKPSAREAENHTPQSQAAADILGQLVGLAQRNTASVNTPAPDDTEQQANGADPVASRAR